MPTHNISSTKEQQELADLHRALDEGLASGVATGDVFARVRRRAALPAEESHASVLPSQDREADLRDALDEGLASGVAPGNVLAQVKREVRALAKKR